MADYTAIAAPQAEWDSHRFARWLTTEVGVAAVAGINFYTRDREKYMAKASCALLLPSGLRRCTKQADAWRRSGSRRLSVLHHKEYMLEGS